MSGTVVLTDSESYYVTLDTPQYPYTSTIKMPMDVVRLDNGKQGIFDHGAAYDTRECSVRFIANSTIAAEFLDVLNLGRSGDWTMDISALSGFFPFGPDKGDTGTFTAAVMPQISPVQWSPYQRFNIGCRMVNTGAYPSYSIPTCPVQGGSVEIGTVTGIRYPQDGFQSYADYARDVVLTEGNVAYYVQKTADGDGFGTDCVFSGTTEKIAQIVAYLTGTARGNSFVLKTTARHWAFGIDGQSNRTYTVQLKSGTLKITHVTPKLCNLEISLSLVSL